MRNLSIVPRLPSSFHQLLVVVRIRGFSSLQGPQIIAQSNDRFHLLQTLKDLQYCRPLRQSGRGKKIIWAIWLVYRTRVAFGWLSELSVKKLHNYMPENFLEINRYFALTSYCKTIGQSNNASSILGFSLAGKRRVHALIFPSTGW